nr:Thymidylate synthase [uncultured bacterium]
MEIPPYILSAEYYNKETETCNPQFLMAGISKCNFTFLIVKRWCFGLSCATIEKITQEDAAMSKADQIFLANCQEILSRGTWDTHLPVRPRWEDGTPAHTVKCFGLVNRYDLREEFPIQTIRRMYLKSAVEELLWIWQKKSNNVRALSTGIWDAWADETGSIGKAYGYQMGVKHRYPEGEMDQVDRVLYDLKHNPSSRRILTNLYNHHDLSEMALYPCAYSMTFNVTGNTLNAILHQRSQDMLTANGWNVMQYAVLVHMLAQVSGRRRASWST